MRKAEITLHSDGYRSYPAVNVKIDWYAARQLPATIEQVRQAEGCDVGFTAQWIHEQLTDEERDRCWQWAIERAWEQLEEDVNGEYVNGERIFGRTVKVYSLGRSGGWAIVDGITADSIESWDAIAVGRWAKFAKFAWQTADDVPYQYVWNLYEHEYTPWLEQQRRIQTFCQEL